MTRIEVQCDADLAPFISYAAKNNGYKYLLVDMTLSIIINESNLER